MTPLLEGLARSTRTLRDADFNDNASGNLQSAIRSLQSQDVRR
jgi:hypothetical protein